VWARWPKQLTFSIEKTEISAKSLKDEGGDPKVIDPVFTETRTGEKSWKSPRSRREKLVATYEVRPYSRETGSRGRKKKHAR